MFILDQDPKKAAKYLIRKHITFYIPIIELVFRRIHTKDNSKKLISSLDEFTTYSKHNYIWLASFYKELQELYKKHISKENKYKKSIIGFNTEFLLPLDEIPNRKFKIFESKYFLCTREFVKKLNSEVKVVKDIIDYSRKVYLLNKYSKSKFVSGYPRWYVESMTIFKSYDYKNRVNIKIDVNKSKGYKYYYSMVSSEWYELKNVPVEMEYVINSLIFPNIMASEVKLSMY